MAKLVTKFKYLKPSGKRKAGGYAKYIATRNGVEKIDESKKLLPPTEKQKKIIENLLKDFPDSKDMIEFSDCKNAPTRGSASDFISRAIEDNAADLTDRKTYADYIATRPGAEKFGSHGLFTDEGVVVNLAEVSRELNEYGGNIYTVIISIRREDAERLGFNTGARWRDMLRTQTQTLAESLKIPMENLRWYAAFHNESYHPHVHLIAYSAVENEGFLTQNGVEKMRSSLAKSIFKQDLYCTYEKQTQYRDELRQNSRELIAEIVVKINSQSYENPQVEELLLHLAERLKNTSGKKVYGYLKSDVKAMVDEIVREISSDGNIKKLYDLWYEQRENVLKTYTDDMPPRIDLVDNKEFKSIKNAVIKEAMNIAGQAENTESENLSEENPGDENPCVEGVDDENLDEWLFYEPTNDSYAEPSETWQAEQKNIQKSLAAKGALRLFRDICNTVQTRIANENITLKQRVDKKLYCKIQEKKHEQGLH